MGGIIIEDVAGTSAPLAMPMSSGDVFFWDKPTDRAWLEPPIQPLPECSLLLVTTELYLRYRSTAPLELMQMLYIGRDSHPICH